MKEKINTGYNPNYSNFIGTADEKSYIETSAPCNSLASQLKHNELVLDKELYPSEEMYLSDELIIVN